VATLLGLDIGLMFSFLVAAEEPATRKAKSGCCGSKNKEGDRVSLKTEASNLRKLLETSKSILDFERTHA
jgi:hypothetical protein